MEPPQKKNNQFFQHMIKKIFLNFFEKNSEHLSLFPSLIWDFKFKVQSLVKFQEVCGNPT